MNIPQQIGTKYFRFGIILLHEIPEEISAIAARYLDVEDINLEILRLWIEGKGSPLDWHSLIHALKTIGLDVLASDICNALHDSDDSMCKSKCVYNSCSEACSPILISTRLRNYDPLRAIPAIIVTKITL